MSLAAPSYSAVWLPTVSCRVVVAGSMALIILLGWFILYLLVLPAGPFFMDPQDSPQNRKLDEPLNRKDRTFEPLLERFCDTAKAVLGLSVASLTVFSAYIGYVAASRGRGPNSTGQAVDLYPVQLALAFPITWQVISTIYLVLFMAFLTIRYEEYLHDARSYTRPWYAFILSCGLSGLACFVLGFVALGWSVLFVKAF